MGALQLVQAQRARAPGAPSRGRACLTRTGKHEPDMGALQLVQAQRAALQVVLDAAWRADHDVQAAPQRALLRLVRAAAVQARCRQRGRLPVVLKVRVHLHVPGPEARQRRAAARDALAQAAPPGAALQHASRLERKRLREQAGAGWGYGVGPNPKT